MVNFKGVVLLTALVALSLPAGKVHANTQDDILALQQAVAALQTTVNAQQTTINAQQTTIAAQQTAITGLQAQLDNNDAFQLGELGYLKLDTAVRNGVVGPHAIFEGVNLHVQNGAGSVFRDFLSDNPPNGLGNLIIGYDGADTEEMSPATALQPGDRLGSHNLVIGYGHKFTGIFGLVHGWNNAASGEYAAMVGPYLSSAGSWSTVIGGSHNTAATDAASVVVGGANNQANGQFSVVIAGEHNTTNARAAVVTSGQYNVANGSHSSITGGHDNIASGISSTISGGIQVEVLTDDTYVDGD